MAIGGERVRFLVELVRTGGEPVTGSVSAEGRDVTTPFCGWLELLALLEAPAEASAEARHGQDAHVPKAAL